MSRTAIVIIIAAILGVVVLLCGLLSVALIAGRDANHMDWEPRLDRDRHHWDSPMWEPTDGSRVGGFLLGLLGLVSCLLLAGGLVVGAAWLANSSRRQKPGLAEKPAEIEALRARYARGEISRDEYITQMEELRR